MDFKTSIAILKIYALFYDRTSVMRHTPMCMVERVYIILFNIGSGGLQVHFKSTSIVKFKKTSPLIERVSLTIEKYTSTIRVHFLYNTRDHGAAPVVVVVVTSRTIGVSYGSVVSPLTFQNIQPPNIPTEKKRSWVKSTNGAVRLWVRSDPHVPGLAGSFLTNI